MKAVKDFPPSFHLLLWNINITLSRRAKVLEYRPTAEVKEEKPVLSWKYVLVNSPEAITRVLKCCANKFYSHWVTDYKTVRNC